MTRSHQPVSRSGRFESGPGQDVVRFTESISFDQRLWRHDILGSIAHANMLKKIGVLSAGEVRAITETLTQIGKEIDEGRFEWREELEDVHMNIEAELTRRTTAGAKLHTGRSRNDQVALDMRLWLRDEMVDIADEIRALQGSLVSLGDRHRDVAIPGYTHLQRGQPVLFPHHLLAYVEMFERDFDRLQDAFLRVNVCPLGSGALAGSSLPLDRAHTAKALGFVDPDGTPRLTQNSMDAVSDRDYLIEFGAVAALLAIHLSRLAEDLILWSSEEFGFIRIADTYTTGSSLMPQKKNPDIAELTRGKSARVIGNLVSLLTLLKGLPMTYNRDLQEDKERLFDTVDTIRPALRINAAMLTKTEVHADRCRQAASDPLLLATDLADYLVRKNVPFREAHHAIGDLVHLAEKKGKAITQLTAKQLKSVHPDLDPDALKALSVDAALKHRTQIGSPGSKEVGRQIRRWKRLLREYRESRDED